MTAETVSLIPYLIEYGLTEKEVCEKLRIDSEFLNRFFSRSYCNFFIQRGVDTKELKRKLSKNARKLNKQDIKEIFTLYNNGMSQIEIAKLYDILQNQVSSILKGEQYKDEINELSLKIDKKNHKKLMVSKPKGLAFKKEEDIINIFKLSNEGEDNKYIASIYNVSHLTINKLLNGQLKHYNDIIRKHNLQKKYNEEQTKSKRRRKLSEDKVLEIFHLRNVENLSFDEISDRIGIGIGTISGILNKKRYVDIIKKNNLTVDSSTYNRYDRRLSEEQIIEIFHLRNKKNYTIMELSKAFNIGKTSIQMILDGKRYKDVIDKHNLKKTK